MKANTTTQNNCRVLYWCNQYFFVTEVHRVEVNEANRVHSLVATSRGVVGSVSTRFLFEDEQEHDPSGQHYSAPYSTGLGTAVQNIKKIIDRYYKNISVQKCFSLLQLK